MEITYNGKRYKWIGERWGNLPLWGYSIDLGTDGTINFKVNGALLYVETKHTIDQLVALGYMEEIKEEQRLISVEPEDVERELTEDIRRFNSKKEEKPTEECKNHGNGIIYRDMDDLVCGYCHKSCRVIHLPDHDKAMEETHGVVDVVEVKSFEAKEVLVGDLHGHTRSTRSDRQLETLTKAVLQLQEHVFNK